jgi:DNA-binding transcriptional MerR regulator
VRRNVASAPRLHPGASTVRIDPEKPLFPISTVAEILGCPQKMLRLYEANHLVAPARSDGQRRLYCQRDIERLELVHYLTHVRRVNLAGVKVIIELLEDYVEKAQWERIVRGVEQAVESLPEHERQMMREGRQEVVLALESESGPEESL